MNYKKLKLFSLFSSLLITHYSSLLAAGDEPSLSFVEQLQQKEDFCINLKDPEFSNGVITTSKGGIITAEGIRIQAQKISYTNRIENGHLVQRVEAEGDLLVEYGSHIFVGQKLEYDFAKQSGYLLNAKTYAGIWFLGGEKIELKADKTYLIHGAFITTCESQENTWDINAKFVKITKEHLLSAKNIKFRFGKLPFFWLPSFKSNLRFFSDPPIRYKFKWDKGIGPRATMRYRVFSWEDFDLFFRLDYRINKGFGAAVESKYFSPDDRTIFLTKNYVAHDKVVDVETSWKRWRFQWLYETKLLNDKTAITATYDQFSDDKMPKDFRSDDFEVNTQERTLFFLTHKESDALASVRIQPRVNHFQSLDQELPLVNIALRPFELGNLGIIAENRVNAGFLDYIYNVHLNQFVHAIHAIRIETRNQIYRPFRLPYFTITPRAGIDAIFYNNNAFHKSIGQGVFTYGGLANTRFSKCYPSYNHMVEPYIAYDGISTPLANLDEHFTFNIDDGYARTNILRAGLRNSLFSRKYSSLAPTFVNDTYLYLFIHDPKLQKTLAKVYTSVETNLARMSLKGGVEWNLEENVWDYANAFGKYTVNRDIAFGLEFRHRSKFDWRKSDHENYILDFARSVSQMLDSPLSDARNTLLATVFMRMSPKVSVQFQTHNGWGRKDEPGYVAAKIDVFTLLACRWQLRTSLKYDPAGGFSPTVAVSLVK